MNYPLANNPANPDALPLYDEIGFGDYWSAADWIAWHRSMKSKYGIDEANRRFISAWHDGIGIVFNKVPIDARTVDSSFRAYAKENGFFDALFSGLGALAKPIGLITDAGDAVSSVGEGVKITGSLAKWVLPAAALVIAYLYLRKATLPALAR